MGTEDDFFQATGPITGAAAFRTHGINIDQGAHMEGDDVGVLGICQETGGRDAVGVHGGGAPAPSPSAANENTAPGTGILGTGGKCHPTENTDRVLHGAGVIGVAGARPATEGEDPRPIPPRQRQATSECLG